MKKTVLLSACACMGVSVTWMCNFENMGKERSSFSVGLFPFSLWKCIFWSLSVCVPNKWMENCCYISNCKIQPSVGYWHHLITKCNPLIFVTVRFLFLLKPEQTELLLCLPKELPLHQETQTVIMQWSPNCLVNNWGLILHSAQYLLQTPESLCSLILSFAEPTQHLWSSNP